MNKFCSKYIQNTKHVVADILDVNLHRAGADPCMMIHSQIRVESRYDESYC